MTAKADFNAEEWSKLVEGPILAGMRVITAGRGGTFRESLAIGKVYGQAREQHGESELLDEIVASPPSIDAKQVGSPEDLARVSRERLSEAVNLLGQKASADEVENYKRFVVSVAEAAAQAHKEGGVLGIGGEQISAEERAALDEIAATLGMSTA
jgi:hypothetical protein